MINTTESLLSRLTRKRGESQWTNLRTLSILARVFLSPFSYKFHVFDLTKHP